MKLKLRGTTMSYKSEIVSACESILNAIELNSGTLQTAVRKLLHATGYSLEDKLEIICDAVAVFKTRAEARLDMDCDTWEERKVRRKQVNNIINDVSRLVGEEPLSRHWRIVCSERTTYKYVPVHKPHLGRGSKGVQEKVDKLIRKYGWAEVMDAVLASAGDAE